MKFIDFQENYQVRESEGYFYIFKHSNDFVPMCHLNIEETYFYISCFEAVLIGTIALQIDSKGVAFQGHFFSYVTDLNRSVLQIMCYFNKLLRDINFENPNTVFNGKIQDHINRITGSGQKHRVINPNNDKQIQRVR